jgi:hypothetical protein
MVVEDLCADSEAVATPPLPETRHELILLDGRLEQDCVVCFDRSAGVRSRSRTWCSACRVGVHMSCYDHFDFFQKNM